MPSPIAIFRVSIRPGAHEPDISMYFGFAFLDLLTLGFYVLAWLFSRKSAALARATHLAPAE